MSPSPPNTANPTGTKTAQDEVVRDNQIERIETAQDDAVFAKFPRMDKVDEFGAHAKTDPREIALVKKLDRYIIVSTHRPSLSRVTY